MNDEINEINELVRKILQVCASCPHLRKDASCDRKKSQCHSKRVRRWMKELERREAEMLKELAEQLIKEIKERVPGVNIKLDQAVTITIITCGVLEKHLKSCGRFNRAKFLNTTANIVEELLKEVPSGAE